MALVWYSALLLAVLSAGLLLQAALLARALRRAGVRSSVNQVKRHLCKVTSWARSAWGQKENEEDGQAKLFGELVRREVDAKRVTYARRCLMTLLLTSTVFTVRSVMSIVSGEFQYQRWDRDLLTSTVYLLSLGLVAFPSLTKACTLDALHCVFMLLPLLFVSSFIESNLDTWFRVRAALLMFCIFCGILNLNARVSAFTYLLFSVWLIYTAEVLNDPPLLVQELVFVIAQVALTYTWQVALYESTKQRLQAKSSRGQRAAVSSLLNMTCDSIVELDDDLKMVEHAPSLANTLFHGNGTSLEGMPFEPYIYDDEDRKLFRDAMGGASEERASMSPDMFHTQLRDAWGNKVRMEVFHVPFLGVDDSMRHLLGFKEPTDTQPAAGPDGQNVSDNFDASAPMRPIAEAPARPQTCLTDTVAAGLMAPQRSAAARRARSAPSGRSGSSASSQRSGASEADALQVDVVANQELSTKYKTPAFRVKYGSPETMIELIPEPAEFTQWLHSIADEVYSGARTPAIEDFASLTMVGCEGTGEASSDTWRVKANFPSPWRRNADGTMAAPERATYTVGLRLCKPKRARGGTSATAEHQPLSGMVEGSTFPGQSGTDRYLRL